MLLNGRAAIEIYFNQSNIFNSSGYGHVISMEFLHSFLRRDFAGKPAVTPRNVGFIQVRLFVLWMRLRTGIDNFQEAEFIKKEQKQ